LYYEDVKLQTDGISKDSISAELRQILVRKEITTKYWRSCVRTNSTARIFLEQFTEIRCFYAIQSFITVTL